MSSMILLAPHNDDETLFAAYTILGVRPHVAICFYPQVQVGRGYTFQDKRPDVGGYAEAPITSLQRIVETTQALRELGSPTWEQWDFPDSNGTADESLLANRIQQEAENHYYCFAPAYEPDGHEQHNLIAQLSTWAFGEDRVTSYLTYRRGYGKSRYGREVEPEPWWPAMKLRALACYESQIQHPSTREHFLLGDLREYQLP